MCFILCIDCNGWQPEWQKRLSPLATTAAAHRAANGSGTREPECNLHTPYIQLYLLSLYALLRQKYYENVYMKRRKLLIIFPLSPYLNLSYNLDSIAETLIRLWLVVWCCCLWAKGRKIKIKTSRWEDFFCMEYIEFSIKCRLYTRMSLSFSLLFRWGKDCNLKNLNNRTIQTIYEWLSWGRELFLGDSLCSLQKWKQVAFMTVPPQNYWLTVSVCVQITEDTYTLGHYQEIIANVYNRGRENWDGRAIIEAISGIFNHCHYGL